MGEQSEITWEHLISTVKGGSSSVDLDRWNENLTKLQRKDLPFQQTNRIREVLALLRHKPTTKR